MGERKTHANLEGVGGSGRGRVLTKKKPTKTSAWGDLESVSGKGKVHDRRKNGRKGG